MKKIIFSILTASLLMVSSIVPSFAATNSSSNMFQQFDCLRNMKLNYSIADCQNLMNSLQNQFFGNLNSGQSNQSGQTENNNQNNNQNNNTNNNTDSNTNNGTGNQDYIENSGTYQKQVTTLVNQERGKDGLNNLIFSANLSKVAQAKAEDMMSKGYFSHTSPTYGSPFDMMKSFGISYTTAGENIAKGQKTPEDVMNGWMNSSGHRANILNATYGKIGVGYVKSSNGTTYWVQMFTN